MEGESEIDGGRGGVEHECRCSKKESLQNEDYSLYTLRVYDSKSNIMFNIIGSKVGQCFKSLIKNQGLL